MKGFFRRDLCHLAVNGKFYLCFIAVLVILGISTEVSASFISLYVMIFLSTSLLGLFSYDEQNGWNAYAAAVPNGRRAQVDGRYLLGLAVAAVGAGVQLLVVFLSKDRGEWALAPHYMGLFLIYVAVLFPVCYRFGNRSRSVMLLLAVIVGVFFGMGGAVAAISGTYSGPPLPAAAISLLVIGAVGMAVSHRISVAIVAGREY